MPNNPYSSFDFNDWLKRDDVDTLSQDEGFDFDEWLRKAEEENRKREEEQERLAQDKAELEKQRKEDLVTATQIDESALTYDEVKDTIITQESAGDSTAINDRNSNGSRDYGLTQISERWVNKGLTPSGLPSFQVNAKTGESDHVYAKVQEYMAEKVPNWNMMSDEFRREALFDEENNTEIGRIIYDNRGGDQWSSWDKILDSLGTKKRIENTGDMANQALAGNAPSLDDISLSFTGASLPGDIDPDRSPILQRNRDRKKRLEEAERPKTFWDKLNEIKDRPSELAPFLSTQNEIIELAEISSHIETIQKADEGGYEPPQESVFKVLEWQTQNDAETSKAYKIADTIATSVPFALELGITWGAFPVAKKTTLAGIKGALKWSLGTKGRQLIAKYASKGGMLKKTGDLALHSAAAIGASGVQTVAIEGVGEGLRAITGAEGGGRIRAATMRYMMDRAGIQEDEKGDLEAVLFEEGDEFWDAFSKGSAQVFIENLSERSGMLLSKIPVGRAGELMRKGVLEKFLKLNPGSKVADFRSLLKKAGWNGVVGEIMEERVGDIGRSLTYNVTGIGDETWRLPGADELGQYVNDIATIEFPSFMFTGGAIGGVTAALSRDKSDLTRPTNALKFLNKSNYKLKVVKNDKSGKFDVQAIIGGKIKMVSSFDTKKEARAHLSEYAVSEAAQLKEFYKQQIEAAADIVAPETAGERQAFPEESKQGQAYISKVAKMTPEQLEKEQTKVNTQLDKAQTDRQKAYRQRQLSAIEDVMAPVEEVVTEEAPVEEAPTVEEAPVEEAPVEEAPVEEAPVLKQQDYDTRVNTELTEDEGNQVYLDDIRNGKTGKPLAWVKSIKPKSISGFKKAANKLQRYVDDHYGSENEQTDMNVEEAQNAIDGMQIILNERNLDFDDDFNIVDLGADKVAVEDTRTPEEIEAENLALQEELGIVETEKEKDTAVPPQGLTEVEVEEIEDIDDLDAKEQQAIERMEKSIGVKKFYDDSVSNYRLTDKMNDAAIIGAGIIRRGAKSFKQFSTEMVNKIGKGVKPYLKKLYNNAKTYIKDYIAKPKIGLGIEVVQPAVERPLAPKKINFNKISRKKKNDTVYTYIFDKGVNKSQFIKDYISAAPSKEDRGGLSRGEYKANLSKMYDSGKREYKKGITRLVKNAQTKKGLKKTLESGKHMMEWYDGFFPYMQKKFGKDAGLVADFIAITSPQANLNVNIGFGLKAYSQYKLGEEFSAGKYPNEMRKRLLKAVKNHEQGTNLPIGASKISNFSAALKGDPNAVVLDLWMAREIGIKKTPSAEGEGFTDAQYRRYEKIIKEVAFDMGVTPRQAQAAIWFGVREGHSPMHKGDPGGLDSVTYEQILEKTMPNFTYTDKQGNEHSLTDLNKDTIQYLHGSFGLTRENLDTIGKALVDTGRYAYDTLSPVMQKLGNRLGVNSKNFKLKFAQFKNDAKEMTDATKKWFKKVVGQMRTWFREHAQKLIDSKPMQKAYERLEDITVKRIVPKGEIPDVAASEESTEKRISAVMSYIGENGLPDKINALKSKNFIATYYSDIMIPISTRLGRIHPELKRIMRKYHERADLNTGKDMLTIEPFVAKMEALRKANKNLYDQFDMAMQNGWGGTLDKLIAEYDTDLLKKHGKDGELPKKMTLLAQDFQGVREVLNGIYKRAVGLDKDQFARYRQLKDFILPDIKNTPKKVWLKAEIIDWLKRNNVKHNPLDTKAQLLNSEALKKKLKSEANKYKNLKKEFDDLDSVVIFDMPYYKNYHPREVDDYQALEGYINDNELEGEFDLAILNKAKSLGLNVKQLTDRQKADAIGMHLRNTTGTISTSAKNMRKRKFVDLDIEMTAFYKDSISSLLSYIPRMNEATSRAALFGGRAGAGVNVENLTNDDIGSFIAGIKAAQDKENPIITPEHEKEIKDIFIAKFGQGNFTSKGVQVAKNVAYMASIGDLLSTLTQLGDLGFAAYRSALSGHPVVLLKAIARATFDRSLITGKDLGMDRISAEYSRDQLRTSKALGKIFKRTGFARIDRLGKEVLVNSVIESMRAEARRKKGIGAKNMDMINAAFGENSDQAKRVVEDLKSAETREKPSPEIISLAYWSLLEHQPVAESEMPAMYLRSNYGKFFYQLKTWGIKALDVYRNEVIDTLFRKKQVKRGLINMGQLAIAMSMANIPPEYIKAQILGRSFHWKDEWFNSMLKLFFISKYDFTETQLRVGNIRFATKKLGGLMPILGKADDVLNDLYTVGKWFSAGLGARESIYYDLRTPTDIPYLGRLLTHRGWDLGMLDWGGAKGRESAIKGEIRHYKNIIKGNFFVKGRELYPHERTQFDEAHRELGIISAAIAQGSKGGYVWQWLGWDEDEHSERNRSY